MSSSVVAFKNQHYAELRRDCIQKRRLFRDPEFPADDSSVFYKEKPRGVVEWKRPGEITYDPHLFVDGISSHDLNQGKVGDCWFVAASSCLALKPNLWKKVIPEWRKQDWDPQHPENYAGIFHFRFWVFGQWTDVVVDDRLPTIDGNLIYCHSNSKSEFWSALLEKAYAKLYGCYESLRGGYTGDAVVDFSGAVFEPINLEKETFYKDQEKQNNLFEKLLKVHERGGIISCGIKAEPHLENGLVKGHAYAVTAVKRVHLRDELVAYFKTGTIPMIRMRNPWGHKEWKGPWSDSSTEWSKISKAVRDSLHLTVEDDGEFWMSFRDWCRHFSYAHVCHIADPSQTWNEALHFGSWTRHDDPHRNREKVALNREHMFHRLPSREPVGNTGFTSDRSVFLRCNLPQGRYVVIPSTYHPGEEGEFMLRIFTNVD
ncbi:hypothetical protein OJAV_G00139430 [Oryzias javanicus]|uniref:Calpain catalytic domain-containing protein n=1 Tax=Oryzias javanicus TaxID=123683 RepID=A0A3S2MBA8_ORYJA|nr:hypothetical protein OJAV_G00139430 [Oryzias javanicus]